MALQDDDSSVGHSFGLEFDGIQIKAITEVTGLKMEQDVIEYKSNMAKDGKYNVKKLPGRWKAGECTLTRPLTKDNGFEKWVKDSQLGKMKDARKGGSIIVFDYEGEEVKRYNLTAAWPKSLELSSMKAGDTSVMTEKLVLTYEKCEPA
ncbi:phage tail protein [Mycolicibacterium mageritense DSM 44476 = CIP 104973]|uniref:Phage tail protein n=2 Tax=Mycolicibacterium TaxID=1866885 RepID=A0A132PKF0_9MYCO|nr:MULTISPECIES: phage tail protein [Mycolicibacterium]MBN3453243.1 phage tail protein [Mycobacterium sp. DSM 3803]OKH71645.1 phage tail protein [Mycobacterium sp. SWH-M3]KWX22816.1 phage tail protein [Mycolicibacterium wolinskyi]MCC9179991.1 phage tail protein [Mycolicibacterium mageritense]MCV7290080.1 phage tail protein [Mycolicibacterium wolinskyi]